MTEVLGEERWRDVRRNRLLEAAGRVFARDGFEKASVEGIAFEAGIGKPTLYRYFPGKEALFEAVFGEALDDLETRLDAVLAGESGFRRRLEAMIAEIVPTFRTYLAALSGFEGAATSSARRRLFQQRRSAIEARLARAIGDGQAAGELRPVAAAVMARLMIGMVRSATNTDAIDDATAVAAIVDLVLNGLAAQVPAEGAPR